MKKNTWSIDTGFSIRVKYARQNAELTASKAAEAIEVSVSTIADWEQGKNVPRTDLLDRLADLYDVSIDWLCGRTDRMKIE